MRIVDSHVHFWDPGARHHDWLTDAPQLNRRFAPEDLPQTGQELVGMVFVQADCRDQEALDEVRWVQSLAARQPQIAGIVAYAPVHLGAGAVDHLRVLADEPLVVGVRRLLQGQPPQNLTDPDLIAGVRLLAGSGLTFDLCVTHDQLPYACRLAAACPQTRFVLDHVGKPAVRDGGFDSWRSDLECLANLPNVTCKLSGLATEAATGQSLDAVRPYLGHALEVFGPGRCMVGSDWPVLTLATTVERWFEVVLDVLSGLGPRERDDVLCVNAVNTYGLTLGSRPSHP